jgi:hypothetical protein
MSDLFDYITWRGDLSFSQSPFNPVDNIILCQLSYLPFDGIVPGPGEKNGVNVSVAVNLLSEKLHEKQDQKNLTMYKEDPDLIKALSSSSRFGNCHLFGYINNIDTDREIQFSALCVYTDDGYCTIIYRGTDFTLVGWKEDFNMSFSEAIPAQIEAADYLEKMAEMTNGNLRLCGHSKGGNLAVYAASHCGKKIQHRITDIYSNDAPGFHDKVINSEDFATIRERIHLFVPQASIVGMFLEHGCDYTVIKSFQNGFAQHILYTWEVTHNNLVFVDKISQSSKFVNKTVREWISNLDNAHREQFFDALYSIMKTSEIESFTEFEKSWFNAVGRLLKSLGSIDEPTKNLIGNALGELFNAGKKNLDTLFPQKKEKPPKELLP